MGHHPSNAAYAYDMQPDLASEGEAFPSAAPQAGAAPRMDVVTGAGREADQEASPAVWQCFKVFCAVVAVFVAVGMARVGIAGLTASVLNANATLSTTLESAQDESSDLELMRSIYGSSTRIRELAESYGMVVSDDSVTLDFTEYASSGDETAETAEEAAAETDTASDETAETETAADGQASSAEE